MAPRCTTQLHAAGVRVGVLVPSNRPFFASCLLGSENHWRDTAYIVDLVTAGVVTSSKKLTITTPAAAADAVANPGTTSRHLSLITPVWPYVGRHKLVDGFAAVFQDPGLSTVMHDYTRVSVPLYIWHSLCAD